MAILKQEQIDRALNIMKCLTVSTGTVTIGRVQDRVKSEVAGGSVFLKNRFGNRRPMGRLSGEQLPRIC